MKKDTFFEVIRGVCILAVVLIHCISSFNVNELNINEINLSIIIRQIINFPVAIFIFMVGYFLNINKLETNYKKYFQKRLNRLIIPFFTWSLFYSLLNLINSDNINIVKIAINFFTGNASAPLYYIIVLIQLLLLSPLIVKIIKSGNKYINYLLISLTPLYLVFLYLYIIITKVQLPLYATIFMGWFIFYYLGVYVKIKGIEKIKNITVKKSIVLVFISLIISILEAYLININYLPYNFAMSQIKMSSIIYSLTIINLIIQIKNKIIIKENKSSINITTKLLLELGNYSYGIYFIHCFWILIITKIFKYYIININFIIYSFLELILVVLLSYISIRVVKKIMKNEIAEKVFGF